MKKEDFEPDGFPRENEPHDGHYNCDNCGKENNFSNGFRVDAAGSDEQGAILHLYSFCNRNCAKEFAHDNGLEMVKATDADHDNSVNTTYTFRLLEQTEEVQAGPVNENPETSEPENEIDPEDVGKNGEEPDIGENSDDPKLVDEKEASSVPKKKITECWAEVVERAKEIAEIAQKIVETNETLKYYKKEYDSLVKKQNDYILTNGNGIQLTFEDCDPSPISKDETPETLPEEVDPDAWKKHSVRVLQGFTTKQMGKIEANFSTLGAVQEWACKDFREKMPGIGQALQDKLIDAMSDYATYWFNQCQERSNSETPENENEDAKDETPEEESNNNETPEDSND